MGKKRPRVRQIRVQEARASRKPCKARKNMFQKAKVRQVSRPKDRASRRPQVRHKVEIHKEKGFWPIQLYKKDLNSPNPQGKGPRRCGILIGLRLGLNKRLRHFHSKNRNSSRMETFGIRNFQTQKLRFPLLTLHSSFALNSILHIFIHSLAHLHFKFVHPWCSICMYSI